MRSQFTTFRSGRGPIRPSSGTRTLRLPHVGYADIIYVSGRSFDMHWEYVSQFFGVFFTADCDTKLPVCLRSARCVSQPTFLDFFDHYEQDSAHISSTTSFSSGWLTEWKRDVVSEVLNYSFSSLATQNSFIGIFFFPQLGQKNGIFSACKLGRCRSRHTRTLSHTSYIVLWLDFRAGRGDAALGRVLGVLFHQLQTGRLGDAAGHPGTTNTLREREKGRKK